MPRKDARTLVTAILVLLCLESLPPPIAADRSTGRHGRSLGKLLMHIRYDPVRLVRYSFAWDITKEILKSWRNIIPTVLLLPITSRMPDTAGVTKFIKPDAHVIRTTRPVEYGNEYPRDPNHIHYLDYYSSLDNGGGYATAEQTGHFRFGYPNEYGIGQVAAGPGSAHSVLHTRPKSHHHSGSGSNFVPFYGFPAMAAATSPKQTMTMITPDQLGSPSTLVPNRVPHPSMDKTGPLRVIVCLNELGVSPECALKVRVIEHFKKQSHRKPFHLLMMTTGSLMNHHEPDGGLIQSRAPCKNVSCVQHEPTKSLKLPWPSDYVTAPKNDSMTSPATEGPTRSAAMVEVIKRLKPNLDITRALQSGIWLKHQNYRR